VGGAGPGAHADDDPTSAASREERKRRQEDRALENILKRERELARRQLASEGKLIEEAAAPALPDAVAPAADEPVEAADTGNEMVDVPATRAERPAPAAEPVQAEEDPATAANQEPATQPVPAPPAPTDARKKRTAKPGSLPSGLARAQRSIRGTRLGQDPTVQVYLDMVDRQEASPPQLAALGSFLAQNGMLDEALAYYHVAIHLEKKDPLLWLNLGTLHRQRNELSAALSAYGETLALDPNNALARYNVGAILDSTGDYQGAIDQYKIALTLDPSLGDPAVNPQAANNERLLAVKLLLYQEQAGSLGLPLVEIPPSGGDRTE
jgi:tetratricopeptide (TPR) repeat protein